MNKFYFFWGGEFSQWYKSNFIIDDVLFVCAEQFMMYKKAELFNDQESMEKILKTDNARKQKHLGKKVKDFNSDIWDEHKYNIVLTGNLAKFTQDKKLKELLLSTRTKTLVEASPYDIIWGIGYDENHPHATQPDKWRGLNLLGKVLMEVREILKTN